jgi:hypothetical protein
MKTLYFDIDGTVLNIGFGQPKSTLANGQLEAAVREAGFQRIICVGNIILFSAWHVNWAARLTRLGQYLTSAAGLSPMSYGFVNQCS